VRDAGLARGEVDRAVGRGEHEVAGRLLREVVNAHAVGFEQADVAGGGVGHVADAGGGGEAAAAAVADVVGCGAGDAVGRERDSGRDLACGGAEDDVVGRADGGGDDDVGVGLDGEVACGDDEAGGAVDGGDVDAGAAGVVDEDAAGGACGGEVGEA